MEEGRNEDSFWDYFSILFLDKLSRDMRKDLNASLAEYGITSAHAMYLIALGINDCQTPISLSKFLDVDGANTNRMIKTLMEHGYVTDDRKRKNSRKFQISLTDSGRELKDQILNRIEKMSVKYMEGISQEDYERFRRTLSALMRNVMSSDSSNLFNKPFYSYMKSEADGRSDDVEN